MNYPFILIIIIIIVKNKKILLTQCPYDTPLLKSNNCFEGYCKSTLFTSKTCTINNTLIKTQWFDNILPVSNYNFTYVDIITMSNGDLLIETSSYPSQNKRIFYGIKKNGRPYFKNITTFKESTNYTIITSKDRFESFISKIKLNGSVDDKEYIISIPKDAGKNFELYDFDNNIIYEKQAQSFFKSLAVFSFDGSVIRLSTINSYYILALSGKLSGINYFCLIKLLFTSVDFINNDPVIEIVKTKSSNSVSVSCFETTSQNIICFYQNVSLDYVIAVYDYNLNNKTFSKLIEGPNSNNIFFKAIHFTGETGAFGYYIYNGTESQFYIQFKSYNKQNNEFSNFFNDISLIKIDKALNLENGTLLNDMIKLSDSKLCFMAYNAEKYKRIFVIIINNYSGEKIKIKYYYSNIYKLYNYRFPRELRISYYNNLIAMATGFKNDDETYASTFLLIFSYPNSTDFDVNITDKLRSFSNIYINPKENCFINNNLFGYIFYGIKIMDFSEGYELKSKNNNTEINKNSILINNDQIEFVLSKKINFQQNGKIEYAMVLTEPDYNEFSQYSPIIDNSYCGGVDDEENFFNKNLYVGKTSYINIIIDSELITNNCDNDENCALCFKEDSNYCITCKYSYKIINSEKKCLTNKTDEKESILTSLITTIPKTTQPIITEPKINQFITTEPKATQPFTTESKTTQPIITEPKTTHPIITEQKTTHPITTEPKTTQPIITHPIIDFKSIIDKSTMSEMLKTDERINSIITDIININSSNICSNEKILKNNCHTGKMNINQANEIKDNLLNKNYTLNKTNTIIITENIIIQLSTLEDQENSDNIDVSNINFGECEEILKKINGIPNSEELIVYKTDIKIEDLSATYVTYEVYHPYSLEKLDLSLCNKVQIIINVPVKLNDNVETLYESLSEYGYNLFNESDSFYNDNCATYTTFNGTDILLSDRKKDIYSEVQNQSMCQVGCELKLYNKTTKKLRCDCSLNQELEELTDFNIEKLFSQKVIEETFYNTLVNSNFKILKCYKLLFTSETIKNIGEIIMTILFAIFIILMIIFCIKSKKKINSYITSILRSKIITTQDNMKYNKNKKKVKYKDERMKTYTIKKKVKQPPKKINKRINTEEKKDKINKSKKISGQNHSGKYYQSNIFLNVNMVKPPNRTRIFNIKNRRRNGLKNKIILKKEKIEIYKGKFKDLSYKKLNNISSEKMINKNKKDNLGILKKDARYKYLNDQELNSLDYKLALEFDKRTLFQYYWSILKKKQLIFFSFIPANDYNLSTIKIALFLISFSLYFSINGFFFSDDTMHKFYEENGVYDIINQIPQILYSIIISSIINIILKSLSLSEKNILEIKEITDFNIAKERSEEVEFCLKIKFIIFLIFSFLIMIFFWYFISCFCAVYINTQYILIKDTLISFCLSMIYPFAFNIIPGFLRIPALRAKNKDKECLYKMANIIALF